MKKKILTFAFAAMTFIPFSGMAENPYCGGCPLTGKELCAEELRRDCRKDCNAFDGITLTADQQGKLDALKEKNRKNRAEQRSRMKAERQRRDSLRNENRYTVKKQYLKEVKEILTPDQYVMFLENAVMSSPGFRGEKARTYPGPGRLGKDAGKKR